MAWPIKKVHDVVALLASATKDADGNGSAVRLWQHLGGVMFVLDVTDANTDAEDKLDVYVQTMLDGTNWVDVVHFTQCAGNGGAKRYLAKITSQGAETMFESSTALAAGSVRNALGDQWRVRWDVTEAGPGGSGSGTGFVEFTFSVTAIAM